MVLPEIKKFRSKEEILCYIKNIFRDHNVIIIHGSAAKNKLKKYGDIDIEVYTKKLEKPYYEIVYQNKKVTLLSVYFYKFKEGKKTKVPKDIRIIKGVYNNQLKSNSTKESYSSKENLKRQCQLVVDFAFKHFRSKNDIYLKYIQKRIK